ncbi:hypothetical protein EW146_g4560 [Bondarzewia mesenterica]|uniref:F-box domain-containing protein n=1 Tax=Bondarzewia mesenterica TaxID=1095465 RepID=A0A4S4LWD3_9AGAM|nr:hypothetical protein EW146_g4560 [Bondarzewia mesenterica]
MVLPCDELSTLYSSIASTCHTQLAFLSKFKFNWVLTVTHKREIPAEWMALNETPRERSNADDWIPSLYVDEVIARHDNPAYSTPVFYCVPPDVWQCRNHPLHSTPHILVSLAALESYITFSTKAETRNIRSLTRTLNEALVERDAFNLIPTPSERSDSRFWTRSNKHPVVGTSDSISPPEDGYPNTHFTFRNRLQNFPALCFDAVILPGQAQAILLTRVNRCWRAVALSTPRLWANLSLDDLPKDDANVDVYFTALKMWLALSTSMLLTLCLKLTATTLNRSEVCTDYMRILFAHTCRWKYVSLRIPTISQEFSTVFNECRPLPLLEALNIDNDRLHFFPGITIFETAPQLRQATITHTTLGSWLLPWSQLQHLIMNIKPWDDSTVDIDRFIDNLSHCSNLQSLWFEFDALFYPLAVVLRRTVTYAVLPELLDLQMVVSKEEGDWDASLLDCLTYLILPKLRSLRLCINLEGFEWNDSFIPFFTNFTNSLQHLEINRYSLTRQLATDMLECLPNLKSLIMGSALYADYQLVLLRALTLHSPANGSGQPTRNLNPKLVHISVGRSGYGAYQDNLEGSQKLLFFEDLTSMVESRWQISTPDVVGQGLRLESLALSEVEEMRRVAPAQLQRIARCAKEGLRIYLR